MKISIVVTSLVSVVAVTAQTSPGAPYDIGNYLPASWNISETIEPGMLYQPNQITVGPSFGAAQTNASADQPFLVIMIDLNTVVNKSTGVQSQFLHILQPNLYAYNSNSNLTFNATGVNASTVVGAPYFPPTPPPGSLHNYNLLLFEQPANFTMPPNFTRFNNPQNELARTYFNVTQFAAESGLGEPVAANYFRALNGTTAQTSSVETQTATSGVAFPSGFSYTSSSTNAAMTVSGTATGTSASVSSSRTSSAATPSSSSATSGASDANGDLGQNFVKAVCLAVAASLPWIW